jgi:hypothetical protein
MIVSTLYGAAAMGSLAVAVLFLKYWRRSLDRLFLLFSCAFAILGVQYAAIGCAVITAEWRPFAFAPRLIAFGLILFAIAEKNRRR